MVIEDYKLIFIHIPKCAGTSIELGILNTLEKTSFKTALEVPAELKDKYKLYYRVHDFKDNLGFVDIQHAPLSYYPNIINGNLSDYHKVAIVRNPWDRIVSEYFWIKQRRLRFDMPFRDFILSLPLNNSMVFPEHKMPASWFLKENPEGHYTTDKIIKYEYLNDIYHHIRIPGFTMPKLNCTKRSNYKDYYDKLTRTVVDIMFKEDTIKLGYEF